MKHLYSCLCRTIAELVLYQNGLWYYDVSTVNALAQAPYLEEVLSSILFSLFEHEPRRCNALSLGL